ncbi:MAG TPA: hypothetical protein VGW38_17150, partial [Chloroflexota bacterium]|nr:hypothetical protein [Chloroflexota bacterium]
MSADTPPSGPQGAGSAGGVGAASPGGALGLLTGVFGKGVAGYATLLIFSLTTITGSMYVLSTRETGRAIRAVAQFEGSSFEVQTAADFQADSGAKTGVVQFENGTVRTVREAITNLAGAIRAVSSTLVDEARREDAARAAAQSARASAFGLSADTQLAVQAPAISADTLRSIAQGNTAAIPTVVPTTAPSTAPGIGPGTGSSSSAPSAPLTPTTPPSQPASIPIIPATVPPAATTSAPLPANPTATPVPQVATSVPPTQTPSGGGDSSSPSGPAAPSGPSAPGPATAPTQAPGSSGPSEAAPTAASAPAV